LLNNYSPILLTISVNAGLVIKTPAVIPIIVVIANPKISLKFDPKKI